MTPVIYKLISIPFVILFIFCLISLIKINQDANIKKESFVNYLEEKKDYKNLIEFGFYNSNGLKENRRVPFLDKVIFEKYQNNKDIAFYDYCVFIKKTSTKLIILFFACFLLFCAISVLLNMK